jgi:hypothetical protein
MPLCYAEQNQIAFGQVEYVQYTREEKFKVMGKDVFHISECVKRNEQEYRQRKAPFHGTADSTSRAEIPQSA